MSKDRQIDFFRQLRSDPSVVVIFIDSEMEKLAWDLWESRADKLWTLTDCASYVLMEQNRISSSLTTDHHFEQAGFERLLKQ